MTRDDVYRRQLDLDVAAIIRGMALAHGLQAAATESLPLGRPTLHPALPGSGRNRDLRPQLDNRAGVERVMGFCTDEQSKRFLKLAPLTERAMTDEGSSY